MTRIRSLLRVKGLHDQVDSSSTRQHGGTGLGLAIVKRILDAHEAPIAVESLPGQGTTFSLRLPVAA
jgi:signal transduction histidine kinase